MKATRHNGRAGKNGTYNPRHNDRRFDVENSDHIDAARVKENVYWDCYRGYTSGEERKDADKDFTFEEIEYAYYAEHYQKYVEGQHERNLKTRHTERDRSIEDLLKSRKTCPEETIYQIGTLEEAVEPEVLAAVVEDFREAFEKRFGSHVHIIDWAMHLDEGTPHIHERHVFDCANRYGEICPQQEKALEELGIPLPDPAKPKGRNNNRKQTFDAQCREMLFEAARRHGLALDEEPSYGGRAYLEKQDYILFKQQERLEAQKLEGEKQEERLTQLEADIEGAEALIEKVSETAYDHAVQAVTDKVRAETQQEDLKVIAAYQKWVTAPERKTSEEKKRLLGRCLDVVTGKLKDAAGQIRQTVLTAASSPAAKREGVEQIKERTKPSILAQLKRWQEEARERKKTKPNRDAVQER